MQTISEDEMQLRLPMTHQMYAAYVKYGTPCMPAEAEYSYRVKNLHCLARMYVSTDKRGSKFWLRNKNGKGL